jgi:hypothetical protein
MTDIEVPESTLISSVENYSELREAFGRSLADRVNQLLKREEKQ